MKLRKLVQLFMLGSLASVSSYALAQVSVGVIEGLSGPPAIVDFGESYLQGLKLALKDHQASGAKTPIKLVVYDDEANPQRAVSLAQRLIQSDNVVAAVGTVSSGNATAMAPIFQRMKVPLMIGPAIASNLTSDFANQQPSFVFRCSMVEKYQIDKILEWAAKNYSRIGLIHSTTGYGIFAAKAIEDGLKQRGSSLAAVEAAAPGVADLTPQMMKMHDAGVQLLLDFHESFELPFRPMARLAYKPVVAGNWGLSSQKVVEIVGPKDIEGTVMGQALDLSAPAAQTFDSRMKKEYGKDYRWPVVAALGYDAGQIVFKAIEKAGDRPAAAAVRDAIERTDGLKAVSAAPSHPFSATNHECLSANDVFLGVWRNGVVVRLK
ncbi:ABC transporter substrate-binding protein [Paraburkholderia caledonica]|uniref:ABC transporter substrate-binding protein n=1 Tax=Paraburkholderia caledonica TaxID=134536 RepID=UPI0003636EB6|nr:ABC transporter substrate-binding protein [Paraburkholderia caledonica]